MKYKKGTFVVVPNIDILDGKPTELQAIFMWLCIFSGDNGQCYPTRKRLSEKCGVSIKTIDRYIKELVSLGLIEKTNRKKDGTKENTSNIYQVCVVETAEQQPSSPDDPTPRDTDDPETIYNLNNIHLTIDKQLLPPERGIKPSNRVDSIYCDLYKNKYGFYPSISNLPSRLKVFNELLKQHTEVQLAWLLIVYFGLEKDKKWFETKNYDVFTFKFNIDKFISYTLNESDYKNEYEDSDKIYPIIAKYFINLTSK